MSGSPNGAVEPRTSSGNFSRNPNQRRDRVRLLDNISPRERWKLEATILEHSMAILRRGASALSAQGFGTLRFC
jgi:hypothetical protein